MTPSEDKLQPSGMNIVHPIMICLSAICCVGFLLSGQWTAAAWPFNTAVWVWLHRSQQRTIEKWQKWH